MKKYKSPNIIISLIMKNDFIQKKKSGGIKTKLALCFLLFMNGISAFAQSAPLQKEAPSLFSNALFMGMLSIALLLLAIILVLGNVVKAAAIHKVESEKRKSSGGSSTGIKFLLVLFITGFLADSLFAQSPATSLASAQNSYWGLDAFTFYFMLILITLELLVVGMLYVSAMQLLVSEKADDEPSVIQEAVISSPKPSLLDKMNASVSLEKEQDILLDHNYDGIRELDNDLPPWWKYGFYLTVIVGVIYFLNYHVFHTGKLQLAEYEEQMAIAAADKKKTAGLLDEMNVSLLKDEASLSSGKSLFLMNCAACHGKGGEGVVGPNLTDDYWIHGGSIKDVFRTIKFGWPEKGMKSWEQDLSPLQMQQVTSYIQSIHGTNPPNGKEKQGELYVEEIAKDSTSAIPKDSTKLVK
jgi:cytochrome c oxidase cbb3-type subunit 3